MSEELPQGWASVTVGDVSQRITKGTTPTSVGFGYADSGIRFIKVESLEDGRVRHDRCAWISPEADQALSRSRLAAGDVLFSIAGTLGRTGAVQEHDLPANTNQALAIIRPAVEGTTNYLRLALTAPTAKAQSQADGRGVGLQNLNLRQVSDTRLALPPLNEQRRIVAKIEALNEKSSKAKQALDAVPPLLEKLRQSILAAAFRGDLTANWRAKNPNVEPADALLNRIRQERRHKWEQTELAKFKAKGKPPTDDKWKAKYQEPEPVDTEGLPELPEGWCWASVEELSTLVTDGDHNPPKRVSSGVPHLTAKAIKNWRILFEECTYITAQGFEQTRARYEPVENDVIITCVGTLGETAVVPAGAIFSADRNLAAIRFIRSGLIPQLGMLALNSPATRKSLTTGSGSTAQPHIYLSDLRSTPLPLPPMLEQQELLSKIVLVLERHAAFAAIATQLDTAQLNSSILAKAFRGQLVPQDPNDEPASVLLDRIRQQREIAANTSSPKNARPPRQTAAAHPDEAATNAPSPKNARTARQTASAPAREAAAGTKSAKDSARRKPATAPAKAPERAATKRAP